MPRSTVRAALAALLSLSGALAVVACEGSMSGGSDAGRAPAPDAGSGRDGAIEDGAIEGGAIAVDAALPDDAGDPPALDGGDLALDDAGGGGGDAGRAGVPIFVAQGYVGRTTISCDDGRTWIANQSADDSIRCFGSGGPDCDHQAGRAKGIVYSHGYFVATYGWGEPGSVRRSRDGRAWETTNEGSTYGGIAGDASSDSLVLGARRARHSEDDGATWSEPIDVGIAVWNVRRTGYAPHDGGRWIVIAEDGTDLDVVISDDGGESYWAPTSIPSSCGTATQNQGGIGYVAGNIVMVSRNGTACRSSDGGRTWTAHAIGSDISSSEVVSTGTEVLVWGGGRMWRSTDGATWSGTSLSPSIAVGAVARSDDGTFVAVNGGWDQWYERQRFYRSEDGVTWEQLPGTAYVASHPMHEISWGMADPSACP